ncbi:sensor histidine kinase [Mycobacterium sp. 236(2023)]|uniref:sensor histidine kinase n=1 Tax=Mycobacterium sp. 236(2023) TaxID=3038163 RepID=UPI00241590F1|nr:sensor histidine kinase [Mycobacterium sp. 236(2023)]MDG4668227.1 sensor histidine kinase [Mycobacterium sp. 236(2023)]
MRTGISAGYTGHFHEAGFYGSDDDLLELIVPFVTEGVDAGEPSILGFDENSTTLLRKHLPESDLVTFVAGGDHYATPARAIANYRKLYAGAVAAGAQQVRTSGQVPLNGNPTHFRAWSRYESAVNSAYDDFPLLSLCVYDTTAMSPEVRDVVERAHPNLLTASGVHSPSPRYQNPASFVLSPVVPDPLEFSTPLLDIADITAALSREVMHDVASPHLDEVAVHDLVLATSETVTNALVHGRPPARLTVWAQDGRVVVHVRDGGRGPLGDLVGLVPVDSEIGAGLGLWLIHQLGIDVDLMTADDGFTVRLCASRGSAIAEN